MLEQDIEIQYNNCSACFCVWNAGLENRDFPQFRMDCGGQAGSKHLPPIPVVFYLLIELSYLQTLQCRVRLVGKFRLWLSNQLFSGYFKSRWTYLKNQGLHWRMVLTPTPTCCDVIVHCWQCLHGSFMLFINDAHMLLMGRAAWLNIETCNHFPNFS